MLRRLLHSRAIIALAHVSAVLIAAAVATTVATAGVPPRHVTSDRSRPRKPTATVTPPAPVARNTPKSATRATNLGAHASCVVVGARRGVTSARACSTRTNVATPATVSPSFTISGAGRGLLLPGGPPVPVDLQFRNRTSTALTVTSVTTRVTGTSVPGCAPDNFVVAQQLTVTPTVPAKATTTLSGLGVPVSSWPELRMVGSGDQQACRGATVYLAFSSTGTGTAG